MDVDSRYRAVPAARIVAARPWPSVLVRAFGLAAAMTLGSTSAPLPLVATLASPSRAQVRQLPDAPTADSLRTLVRERVEGLRAGGDVRASGRLLMAREALPTFYEERGFEPAWVGVPEARVRELTETVAAADAHGLDPADYHLEPLRSLVAERGAGSDVHGQLDLELLATDAFLMLGSHLLQGRVHPESVEAEWLANRRGAALHHVLAEALEHGRIRDALLGLAPRDPRYRRLMGAMERLRSTAREGGWPTVPEGPVLEPGVDHPAVAALRRRLAASGDYTQGDRSSTLFDEGVATAVRRFQLRHGLDVDGVVGSATRTALNVPAEVRARQIEVNLERWRWLPDDLGARHIEINIAGFEMQLLENGRIVRRHRAVVGQLYRQTPMFSASMTYLVLSPYWHVPPGIAELDKLPAIRRDPSVLSSQRMTLLDRARNQPVDPSEVDWSSISAAEFNSRYRLRQAPGPWNALGQVKFMFPNPHNVYLHDTPSRELFGRSQRTFSSGCIRIEDALDLAEELLSDQPEWPRARIEEVAAGGQERVVRLATPVPVHLLYWTAWVEPDGALNFRNDIYRRDVAVRAGLTAAPPSL